jgi:ribonuclease HII
MLPDTQEWKRLIQLHYFERLFWKSGAELIAGADEAGRGPLAGPVVAAVVVLRKELLLPGLNDSTRVNPGKRALLAQEIRFQAAASAVGIISPREIEKHNIHQATFMAFKEALDNLNIQPDHLLVDGWPVPGLKIPQTPLIKGDARSASIAAASLLAKATRDELMVYYGKLYPEYGFPKHKGYPTREHLEKLRLFGPCILHRRNFRGVSEDAEVILR